LSLGIDIVEKKKHLSLEGTGHQFPSQATCSTVTITMSDLSWLSKDIRYHILKRKRQSKAIKHAMHKTATNIFMFC
jgi:hypothetical protein